MNNNKDKTLSLVKQVIDLSNQHISIIQKLKVELFKENYIVDIVLVNFIFNLRITDVIKVDLNNKMFQYTLDFYNNEKVFNNYDQFREFFEDIAKGVVDKTNGLVAIFNKEEYLCEIEVKFIDSDRQMGPEIFYEISFTDNEGEDIIAAEVSEYPVGSFSIHRTNPLVQIDEQQIINYFYLQNKDDDDLRDEFYGR